MELGVGDGSAPATDPTGFSSKQIIEVFNETLSSLATSSQVQEEEEEEDGPA
jgi:hypothetical protein